MPEEVKWIDNIGNEIEIGHLLFIYTGNRAHTIQKVKNLSVRHDDFGDQAIVILESGGNFNANYVLSLSALGINKTNINRKNIGLKGYDALGNKISLGDKLLFVHAMEFRGEIGIVKKFAQKTCLMDIMKNRFEQEQYKKKYNEVISLNAIGKQDLLIKGEVV